MVNASSESPRLALLRRQHRQSIRPWIPTFNNARRRLREIDAEERASAGLQSGPSVPLPHSSQVTDGVSQETTSAPEERPAAGATPSARTDSAGENMAIDPLSLPNVPLPLSSMPDLALNTERRVLDIRALQYRPALTYLKTRLYELYLRIYSMRTRYLQMGPSVAGDAVDTALTQLNLAITSLDENLDRVILETTNDGQDFSQALDGISEVPVGQAGHAQIASRGAVQPELDAAQARNISLRREIGAALAEPIDIGLQTDVTRVLRRPPSPGRPLSASSTNELREAGALRADMDRNERLRYVMQPLSAVRTQPTHREVSSALPPSFEPSRPTVPPHNPSFRGPQHETLMRSIGNYDVASNAYLNPYPATYGAPPPLTDPAATPRSALRVQIDREDAISVPVTPAAAVNNNMRSDYSYDSLGQRLDLFTRSITHLHARLDRVADSLSAMQRAGPPSLPPRRAQPPIEYEIGGVATSALAAVANARTTVLARAMAASAQTADASTDLIPLPYSLRASSALPAVFYPAVIADRARTETHRLGSAPWHTSWPPLHEHVAADRPLAMPGDRIYNPAFAEAPIGADRAQRTTRVASATGTEPEASTAVPSDIVPETALRIERASVIGEERRMAQQEAASRARQQSRAERNDTRHTTKEDVVAIATASALVVTETRERLRQSLGKTKVLSSHAPLDSKLQRLFQAGVEYRLCYGLWLAEDGSQMPGNI